MNEQCTLFGTNPSRIANNRTGWHGQVRNALNWQILRNYCESRGEEALFAEALMQIERARAAPGKSVLLDWEEIEKNPTPNSGLSSALSCYPVKLLASAIASYKSIYGTRLQRQVRTVITRLSQDPYPSHSTELPLEEKSSDWQARKIQLDFWWIFYAVDESKRQTIVIEIASGENDCSSIASQENMIFSDRYDLLGNWAYHYC